MDLRPFISYPDQGTVGHIGPVIARGYVNVPGQVSFSTIDYIPGWFIATHTHGTWELILIDGSSEGPGYTFFDNQWWRADPGSAAFFPRGYSHAWCSGNKQGFKMLAVYGGSYKEAGRTYAVDPKDFRHITPEEEANARAWTPPAGKQEYRSSE